MLDNKQVQFLRDELTAAKNPLFIYDDDADGLTSFLLLYMIHREGKGIPLKMDSTVTAKEIKKVEELNPDKIFILDIPIVEQEFIDLAKRPIFWIDHHNPLERKNVHYYNPRIKDKDAYVPTSRMCWQVNEDEKYLWIAAAGSLADWHMPDFIGQFIEKYPSYLPEKTDLSTAVFQQPVGKLVKMFFFLLKGPTSEVRKSISILTKIESPDEIMLQTTARGKFLYKRFESIDKKYETLLKEARKKATRSELLLFYYDDSQWSFTANLANELSSAYPKKVIIIVRKKSGKMKCSLRGQGILPLLEKSLLGISGYGGGHPDACGAVIDETDWDAFLRNFKQELKEKAEKAKK